MAEGHPAEEFIPAVVFADTGGAIELFSNLNSKTHRDLTSPMRFVFLAIVLSFPASAQTPAPESRMRPVIERYQADLASLEHALPVRDSAARRERLDRYYAEWLDTLNKMTFESLN